MAVEQKRACGYRKVGGLYLIAGPITGIPCDRLPIPLSICPTCKRGLKQTRAWTWVNLDGLVNGTHKDCREDGSDCPLCWRMRDLGDVGLLWIGKRFYPSYRDFVREGEASGISRRLSQMPRGFEPGVTWTLFAHPETVRCPKCLGTGKVTQITGIVELPLLPEPVEETQTTTCEDCKGRGMRPGIFYLCRAMAIEKIVTETQARNEKFMEKLAKRKIRPVVVPDDDPDHQGTAYDKPEQQAELALGSM